MTVETTQHFTLTPEEVAAFRLVSSLLATISTKAQDANLSDSAYDGFQCIETISNIIDYPLTN